ncbi:hypothetical protein YC2023_101215 [Brassica napus]
MKAEKSPIQTVMSWIRRQPPKVKAFLCVVTAMTILVFLRVIVHEHDNLFIASEAVHAVGISVLIYKLTKEKTCAGISLKTQELTALFLAVRLYCSFVMEFDLHTLLDSATLATTLWVIYMIRFNLRPTYMEDKDNFAIYYVVVPCAVMSLLIHPSTRHHIINRLFWAFCVYLEAVSVLPQLRVMQNTKIVEPFTAHYVFALGIARFLSCAHWILQTRVGVGYEREVTDCIRFNGWTTRSASSFWCGPLAATPGVGGFVTTYGGRGRRGGNDEDDLHENLAEFAEELHG